MYHQYFTVLATTAMSNCTRYIVNFAASFSQFGKACKFYGTSFSSCCVNLWLEWLSMVIFLPLSCLRSTFNNIILILLLKSLFSSSSVTARVGLGLLSLPAFWTKLFPLGCKNFLRHMKLLINKNVEWRFAIEKETRNASFKTRQGAGSYLSPLIFRTCL